MSNEESLLGAPTAQDVGAGFQALEAQISQLQAGVKLETGGVEDRESVKVALEGLDRGVIFNESVASQYMQARQQQVTAKLEVLHLQNAVRENVEVWETAAVLYTEFNFNSVPQDERKFVRLLAKELGEVDWSTKSVKSWITVLQKQFNENFILSRQGRLAVIFNACAKSTQDRLLAANFGRESAEEEYTFITLIKTLGAI